MRPRTRIFRLAAAAGALGVVAAPAPASAGASVESRWWSPSPVLAPDVTDEQLLVQGSPDPNTPLAYAGISFTLGLDELPSKLVLQQAPDGRSTPGAKLALCTLKGAATSEAAPGFDCATKADGTAGADGTSYEFDVSALAGSGSLSVAVVPTQPTDRVVLAKPSADALQSSPAASSSTSSFGESGNTDSTGFGDTGGFAGGSFGSGTTGFDVPSTALPSAAAPSTPTATTVPKREVQLAAPAAATSPLGGDDDGRSFAPFAFFGLAGAAAVLWSVAGRESEDLEAAAAEV